ncbi:MAG: phosphoglycerate kinase [Candidatus Pacebacteria bacterium]|nr:phosphoglycerate kinase [Candidatus Paceibacterota bacterium]
MTNNFFLSNANNLKGKRVLVRVGVNVPLDEKGNIESDFRLKAVLPTLKFLIDKKAKIILIGHIGRDSNLTLKKIFKYFKKKEKLPISFDEKTFVNFNNQKVEELKSQISSMKKGEILFLDNLRATDLEKENNVLFAKNLSEFADVYVNEAFSVSHRKHASISELPKNFTEKYFGIQFEKELEFLNKIKELKKESNSIFVLGGAKIKSKLPILDILTDKFDKVIVGGAIINNFYKFLGYEIGNSVYDKEEMDLQKYIDKKNLFIPNLVIVKNKKGKVEKEISEVNKDDKILDISPSSFLEIEKELKEAKIIFFNGPLGYYEGGFKDGTKYLFEILANKENLFIAGGGNTSSVIYEMGLGENVDFISTGGGSLVEYIAHGTLLGIEAIINK